MAKYVRVESPVEAMQWLLDNKDAVFKWLDEQEIAYSFHEITSAGELIVYLPRPTIVPEEAYIIKGSTYNYITSQGSFESNHKRVTDEVAVDEKAAES